MNPIHFEYIIIGGIIFFSRWNTIFRIICRKRMKISSK